MYRDRMVNLIQDLVSSSSAGEHAAEQLKIELKLYLAHRFFCEDCPCSNLQKEMQRQHKESLQQEQEFMVLALEKHAQLKPEILYGQAWREVASLCIQNPLGLVDVQCTHGHVFSKTRIYLLYRGHEDALSRLDAGSLQEPLLLGHHDCPFCRDLAKESGPPRAGNHTCSSS